MNVMSIMLFVLVTALLILIILLMMARRSPKEDPSRDQPSAVAM